MRACLYDRLGGAAAVAAVVDNAVDRHAANPALAPRFHGKALREQGIGTAEAAELLKLR